MMPEALDNNTFFILGCCGSVRTRPDFNVRREGRYPYCLIHYIHSGTMYLDYNDAHYTVHSGESFLLPAYSTHRYYAQHPAQVTWAEFYGVNSQNVFENVIAQNGPVIKSQASTTLLHDLEALKHICKEPYRTSRTLFGLLMNLMEGIQLCPTAKPALQDAIQYIGTHLAEKLDTETLAGLCGYSNSYFSRLFHRTYGVTATQYILQQRLECAKHLLEQPEQSIAQIAESTGFSDSSHFIKLFRKTYGETPNVFRHHLSMYLGQSL